MNQLNAEKYLEMAYDWLNFAKEDLENGEIRQFKKDIERCEIRIKWVEEELRK